MMLEPRHALVPNVSCLKIGDSTSVVETGRSGMFGAFAAQLRYSDSLNSNTIEEELYESAMLSPTPKIQVNIYGENEAESTDLQQWQEKVFKMAFQVDVHDCTKGGAFISGVQNRLFKNMKHLVIHKIDDTQMNALCEAVEQDNLYLETLVLSGVAELTEAGLRTLFSVLDFSSVKRIGKPECDSRGIKRSKADPTTAFGNLQGLGLIYMKLNDEQMKALTDFVRSVILGEMKIDISGSTISSGLKEKELVRVAEENNVPLFQTPYGVAVPEFQDQ